jgi:cytochrome c oxidase assembly protein subunit 17
LHNCNKIRKIQQQQFFPKIELTEKNKEMPREATKPEEIKEGVVEKKKLKPCCACPETKKPRDECIMENGEENCADLIEAHKQCMRDMGFKI